MKKIVLVSAGGLSTGTFVAKMQKLLDEKNAGMKIEDAGLADCVQKSRKAAAMLIGPQLNYKEQEIAWEIGKPCLKISSREYALMDVETVYQHLEDLLSKK